MLIRAFLGIFSGYFIGSILPAYFLTLFLTGQDIRERGTGHAGTTNVLREVGLIPGMLTAIIDVLKGIAALLFARSILGLPETIAFVSGFAAVLGHVFPFYLHFRGGRGAATTTGLLLYFLFRLIPDYELFPLLSDLGFLLALIGSVILIAREENMLAIVIIPAFSFIMLFRFFTEIESFYILTCNIYIFVISTLNIRKYNLLKLENENFRLWRVLIRPFAFSFPALSFFIPVERLILLIGVTLALFAFLDISRLLLPGAQKVLNGLFPQMYKRSEKERISSITGFLLGVFIAFLLFDQKTAVAVVSFSIFGDMSAKIAGKLFGRRKIFGKTLEGSLAFLTATFVLSYVLSLYAFVPFWLSLTGGVVATIVELLPLHIDDNVSVPLLSGLVMYLFS
ncbi:hypothetical protein AT15_08520 [Kosmotoga arenicorallina S304]|uniref:Glycerol-3-phosphate acyltransferase n=1 Tax=Kosmotoga arenicorallina S304 TaxID=1453497 RepID=A0A176K1W8_9BACT|nr:glycerol-3-phosphate acyltransferase [Kosmotoga arenicorallina]OAA31010.1 hypothetical protein AT15_08520 [Kosmotoga arenicorallina S304]